MNISQDMEGSEVEEITYLRDEVELQEEEKNR